MIFITASKRVLKFDDDYDNGGGGGGDEGKM
jgi:hypothetical protein